MDNSALIEKLIKLYKAGKINVAYLVRAISLGLITLEQKNEIITEGSISEL